MCRQCKQKKCSCEHKQNKYKYCYDYIIVGAGTGGAALAAKLSDPNSEGKFKNSVLVIESGQNLSTDPQVLVNNVVLIGTAQNPKYSKTYSAQLQGSYDFTGLYSEGRCIGGSSSHNGLQAYRGAPKQYDEWVERTGENRWSYDSLLENVIKPAENYAPDGTALNPDQRGTNGPMFITQEPSLATNGYVQGFINATGTPYTDDLNDPTLGVVGIGSNQDWVTPTWLGPNCIRSFTGNSYLTGIASPDSVPPVEIPAIIDEQGFGLNGRKLRVIFSATVTKVIFDKCKNAKGVEFYSGDKTTCILAKACKEVILCAGTFNNPAILQRSGVGDETILTSLGIDVVYNNPNVGLNMQNHYGTIGGIVLGNPEDAIPVVIKDDIILVQIANAFISLPGYPENERIMQVLNFDLGGLIPGFPPGFATGLLPLITTTSSYGSVKIVSTNPFVDPQIDLNIYSDGPYDVEGTDANKIVKFLNLLPEIAAQIPGGGGVFLPPPEFYDGGDEGLFNYALENINLSYHTSGTCRMSTSSADGVVDGKLRVFGVNRLRVADCSAAPVIITANTASQGLYIGLECARIIKGL